MTLALTRRAIPDQPSGYALNDRASNWGVVVPEATTNLVINPSLETTSTGYTPDGAIFTLNRVALQAAFGTYSLEAVTTGNGGGWYIDVTSVTSNGILYTFSVWLRGYGRVNVQGSGAGSSIIYQSPVLIENQWRRYSLSFTWNSSYTLRVVGVFQNGAGAFTWYSDGVQLEAKSYPTTYCDGDQEGCFWTSTTHASSSQRDGFDARGGRLWSFADLGFTVQGAVGAGAPAVNVIDTSFALNGGGYYQRTSYPIRQFSIVGAYEGLSPVDMKRRRSALYDAIKADRVSPQQLVRLVHRPFNCDAIAGGGVNIDAVFAGGLEGNEGNEFTDRAALGFRSYQPGIAGKAEIDTTHLLDIGDTAYTANRLIWRNNTTGDWRPTTASGPNARIRAIAITPSGILYVGGDFTSSAGVANTAYIAQFNPFTNTWSALGTGMNNPVYALVLGNDGSLYAGGEFTLAGGVANTINIARWNGTAWNALGTGGNARVRALAYQNGVLYGAGDITSLNGTTVNRVFSWNGSAATNLSSSTTGTPNTLVIVPNGTIYIAGSDLTVVNGVSVLRSAQRSSAGVWTAMGNVNAGASYKMHFHLTDSSIYLVGESFTTADSLSVGSIARWNGTAWVRVGGDTGSIVGGGFIGETATLPDGSLIVGGDFTTISGISVLSVAVLTTGNVFAAYDLRYTGEATAFASNDRITAVGGTSITQTVSISTSVVNTGAVINPDIVFNGPGQILPFRNFTTRQNLYFNLTLNTGERAVLKTGLTPSFTSNFRGDILNTILPGSNVSGFKLIPGTNYISVFMDNATDQFQASLVYRRAFDTIDRAVLA